MAIPLDIDSLEVLFVRLRFWGVPDDDPVLERSGNDDEEKLLKNDLSKIRAFVNVEEQLLYIAFTGEEPRLNYDYGFVVGEEVLALLEAARAKT